MTAYIHEFINFIVEHPNWVGALVFLTAMTEAIAVIGLFIPGTTILIGVGTVIGLGHLALWPVLIWATLGAIVGDGISYWLGHRYSQRIFRIWPFSRRPQLLLQGEAFFRRHGGKSVAIGRFLPVTRAVIPLVAGVLGMRPWRFYAANVLSALLWAPAHILPGAAIGTGLALLGGISGRLLVVLVGLVLIAVATAWLLRLAIIQALPLLARAQIAVVAWARLRTGRTARLVVLALNPDDPGSRTVLFLGAILIFVSVGFVSVLEDIVTRDTLVRADAAVSHLIQSLRTSWADNVMTVCTMLGDPLVTGSVAISTIAWLAWRRHWRITAGFTAGLGVSAAFVWTFKTLLKIPRPIAVFSGVDAFSFPSGHATMAATLYGMLAWLAWRSLSYRWRVLPVLASGMLVGAIAASRIYLAAHWPSDVVAGMLFGFGIAALFGLVFNQSIASELGGRGLIAATMVTFLIVGTWHSFDAFEISRKIYARQNNPQLISQKDWLSEAWARLPQRRIDLEGETEEPFVLQWTGSAKELRDVLTKAHWSVPTAWSLKSLMSFANGSARASDLPVLPLLHNGRPPILTLIAPRIVGDRRETLRVWPSSYAISTPEGARSIFVVSVLDEHVSHPLGLFSLPLQVTVPRLIANKTHIAATISSNLGANCYNPTTNGTVAGAIPLCWSTSY